MEGVDREDLATRSPLGSVVRMEKGTEVCLLRQHVNRLLEPVNTACLVAKASGMTVPFRRLQRLVALPIPGMHRHTVNTACLVLEIFWLPALFRQLQDL